MNIQWPVLVLGSIAVGLTPVLWKNREQIAKRTAESQQVIFGDWSKRFQQAATKRNMGYPIIGLGAIGIFAIVTSIFAGGSF